MIHSGENRITRDDCRCFYIGHRSDMKAKQEPPKKRCKERILDKRTKSNSARHLIDNNHIHSDSETDFEALYICTHKNIFFSF